MRDAETRREGLLEANEHRPERQAAGAQHLEHELLLALPDDGLRERDHGEVARRAREWCARPGSMPASRESTSASQLASITFSETPIAPQVSVPSEASRRTRVMAPVPFVSSMMRALKLTSSMSRRCGKRSPIALRSALSSAFTGPLPSAVRR